MILLYNKTFEDLTLKANAELTKAGFSTSAGSIAKLLLNIINTELAEFYNTLTLNHMQSFLSTSTGDALDAIGKLLNCTRQYNESDEDFKYRISKQILLTASANETAIKLAALSVPEVQDVVLQNYSYGSGSFTVLIITDKVSADASVIENVRLAVEEVAGYGIRFNIADPDILTVSMKIKVLTKDTMNDGRKQDVLFLTRDALKNYLTTRSIGESLIVNEITKRIMEVDKDIVSYTCNDFRINDKLTMFVNQECKWNNRYMLSKDPNAIIIS